VVAAGWQRFQHVESFHRFWLARIACLGGPSVIYPLTTTPSDAIVSFQLQAAGTLMAQSYQYWSPVVERVVRAARAAQDLNSFAFECRKHLTERPSVNPENCIAGGTPFLESASPSVRSRGSYQGPLEQEWPPRSGRFDAKPFKSSSPRAL